MQTVSKNYIVLEVTLRILKITVQVRIRLGAVYKAQNNAQKHKISIYAKQDKFKAYKVQRVKELMERVVKASLCYAM